jgi:hypothetical protein
MGTYVSREVGAACVLANWHIYCICVCFTRLRARILGGRPKKTRSEEDVSALFYLVGPLVGRAIGDRPRSLSVGM